MGHKKWIQRNAKMAITGAGSAISSMGLSKNLQ